MLTFYPVVLHTPSLYHDGVCCGWMKTSDQNMILWKSNKKSYSVNMFKLIYQIVDF